MIIARFEFANFSVTLESNMSGYTIIYGEREELQGWVTPCETVHISYGVDNPARQAMDSFARMADDAFSRTSRSMFTQFDPNI